MAPTSEITTSGAGHAPHNYHPENIQGKTAIVTGGTTGIGLATAKLLVERGANVLLFGRDEDALQSALREIGEAAANGGQVQGISADQTHLEDVRRVFAEADARFGKLDILVNNAAVAAKSLLESEPEEIAYGLNANLLGPIACTWEAVQRMKKAGSGHIVNIGSMSANLREEDNDVYVATKAAIQGFSESVRKVLNPMGIKVTLIEPGRVSSDMVDAPLEEQKKKQEAGELLQAGDIAEAVHYCLTQPARTAVVSLQIRPLKQAI
jgi:NADP-dependent 3-hydroxy acid dehydrogenase YdfG